MNKTQTRSWIALISPILVLVVGNIAARFFSDLPGRWAWTGYFTVYWIMLILFMTFTGKRVDQQSWFRKSQGSRWWAELAIGIGFVSFSDYTCPTFGCLFSIYEYDTNLK